MPDRAIILAIGCVACCAALVAWKITVLNYSLDPRASVDRWNVELIARATGTGEPARLLLSVPIDEAATPGPYDQHYRANGLELGGVRSLAHGRFATFSSKRTDAGAPISASYRFSVRVQPGASNALLATPDASDTSASAWVPSNDDQIRAKARHLTPDAHEPYLQARALYDFVLDEIVDGEDFNDVRDDSALDALRQLRGSAVARVRLFVALSRSLSIPARVVHAAELVEGANRPLLVRADVFLDGEWVPVDPVRGRFGAAADEGFVIARGGAGGALVRSDGLSKVHLTASVTREGLNEYALYRRRMAQETTLVDRASLHGLPPRLQLAMRLLLLVPLGALIVSIYRNFVGTPTFGTFMPILIALALRETRPLAGLTVLGVVLVVGILGRRFLSQLRLLVVPRLSLLLTFVIFIVGALAVFAVQWGLEDALNAALLPMVIMTMTIERVGIVVEEEGVRSAVRTTAGTVLVAGTGYFVFQSEALQRTVFTFPELNLLVVAALLLVGRYTGYRLTELIRFRSLAKSTDNAPESAA